MIRERLWQFRDWLVSNGDDPEAALLDFRVRDGGRHGRLAWAGDDPASARALTRGPRRPASGSISHRMSARWLRAR